jgi:potassium efflux system protein
MDDPDLEASAIVFSRPVAAAVLLFFTEILFFYGDPPRVVDELATTAILIPLYRLLPPKLLSKIRGKFFWLVGLFVLSRLIDLLPYLSLLRRLLQLMVAVATFAIIVHAIRKDTSSGVSWADTGKRALRWVEKTAAFLLAVAIVSSVLGNLSLTDVIVTAVILSAYAGLVFYALYLVINGIVRIGIRTRFCRRLRMVRRHEPLLVRRTMTIVRIVIVIFWVTVPLRHLYIFEPVVEGVRKILTAEARFGEVGLSLGGVLGFAVTVWVAFMISRVIRFMLDEDVFPRLTLPRGAPHAITTAFHYIILLFGFFLALAATGANLGKFSLLAGAFGVGIGFGLQSVVNNFISGLILIAERPVMPGDTIEVGQMIGQVKRIGMRSSTVRTLQGAEVIVPNGNLISSEVINWTLSDRQRRVDIPVGVAYGSPVAKVLEILKAAGAGHTDVLENPAPSALFMGFGDSSLDFELRIWTTAFDAWFRVRSEVITTIESALNDAGIVIPFPQRDLHVRSVAQDAGKSLRGEVDASAGGSASGETREK